MPFPYKTVLVTGATSGIGLALAERLMEHGVYVVAVGRRKDRLDALLAQHGPAKLAIEPFDIADVDTLPAWAKKMTDAYPALDCILLNAGIQRTVDFTDPSSVSLASLTQELHTNYLSPLHTLTLFLPHLQSLAPSPAAIILVTSGLALVPFPRCPNYCASKAAAHFLAWTLRAQLAAHPPSAHVRVVEVVPPAVQTELHALQPELVRVGQANVGIPLAEFLEDAWAGLERGDDEVLVSVIKDRYEPIEGGRKAAFQGMLEMLKPKA